jgi:3-methyladenine DNA glycosylase AlkD
VTDPLVKRIRAALRAAGTAGTRESGARFFKEKVKLHGVKAAEVRKIAAGARPELKAMDKPRVFALCGELWRSGVIEEIGVACEWAYSRRKEFVSEDFAVFAEWVERYVDNWASCDTLCNHCVGDLVTMYPERIADLKKWTASPNRWPRRAAAVSLIIPARRGLFLDDAVAIAEALIGDGDDMVQKGYGWMLKAAGEAHPDEVFAYLMSRRDVMPRTAFRYALEKLPADMRKRAMAK